MLFTCIQGFIVVPLYHLKEEHKTGMMELQEDITQELTPIDKAFSAGYQVAENLYLGMVREGVDIDKFIKNKAYDAYIAALAEYSAKIESVNLTKQDNVC